MSAASIELPLRPNAAAKKPIGIIRFLLVTWVSLFVFGGLFLGLKSSAPKPISVIPIQGFMDSTGHLGFAKAREELQFHGSNQWKTEQLDFLSDLYPIWIKFEVPVASGLSKVVLHGGTVQDYLCVDEKTGTESITLQPRIGPYWVSNLDTSSHSGAWICRIELYSPGSLSVELHYAEKFVRWANDFKEKNFLVQGALLTMCIMSAVLMGLVGYRKSICLVVWIALTLHFLAMSGAWEVHLYTYRLFNIAPLEWRQANLVLVLFAMAMFAYFIAQEHRSYWSSLYVRGLMLIAAFAALMSLMTQSQTSFLMWYWPSLLLACCLSCLMLYTWFTYSHRRKNSYLYMALFTFLVGAFFELMSPWVNLETIQHAVGGRAIALAAAVLIVFAVSDSINRNRGQKIQLLKKLEASMQDLEAFFQLIPQAVFMLNNQGEVIRTNRVFDVLEKNIQQNFGLSVLGENPMELIQRALQTSSESVENIRPYGFTLSNRQGVVQHFELQSVYAPMGFIGVIRDTTAERTKELAQFYQIIHDEETGAMNKAGLEHLLSQFKEDNLEHCSLIRLEITNPGLMANGHVGAFSNLALRQFAGQVKGACQFLGDLVYLGQAVFVVLAKPGKGEQARDLFQEARLWSRFKLDGPSDSPYMVNIASLLVDLRHGPIDALNQIAQPKRYVSAGSFQLAVGRPAPRMQHN